MSSDAEDQGRMAKAADVDFDDLIVFQRVLDARDGEDAVAVGLEVLANGDVIGAGTRGLIAQIAIDHDDSSLLAEIAGVLRRRVQSAAPLSLDLYHLGNVLMQVSELDGCGDPDRYLQGHPERREGRRALAMTGDLDDDESATKALTNLGNWLDGSGRWVEAYDAYLTALEREPDNGMAYGNAAELLFWRSLQPGAHQPHLYALGCELALLERAHRDKTLLYGGHLAAARFDTFPTDGGGVHPQTPPEESYARWVEDERLALGLTVEGLAVGPQWDDVGIDRLHVASERIGASVPALFAMMNTIKQDYLLARQLAFHALGRVPAADTATYANTLDEAVYGQGPAELTLAQRAALDLLDRLAVMVNEYLEIGIDPRRVTFKGLWTVNKHAEWRPAIRDEVAKGNRSILALADLSFDLDDGGYLFPFKSLRNAGTHRFVVLHDVVDTFDPSNAVEHMDLADYEESLLATLRIARAAILYVVELIRVREERIAPGGPAVYLDVPDHHPGRG